MSRVQLTPEIEERMVAAIGRDQDTHITMPRSAYRADGSLLVSRDGLAGQAALGDQDALLVERRDVVVRREAGAVVHGVERDDRGGADDERAGIAARELYLHLPFDNTEIDELLDGAWDTLEVCSIDFPKQHLAAMLQRYTVRLLTQRQAFDTYTFRTYIQAELVLGPTLTTA